MSKTPEEILEDNGYSIEDLKEEETILFRNPDYSSAICGMSDDYRAIYNYDRMLDFLVVTEQMSYEDAADFVSYDTIRSLSYCTGKKPIIMFPLIE